MPYHFSIISGVVALLVVVGLDMLRNQLHFHAAEAVHMVHVAAAAAAIAGVGSVVGKEAVPCNLAVEVVALDVEAETGVHVQQLDQ